MEWSITLILSLVVILLLYWKSFAKENYWTKRGIPNVKPVPFFGNVLDIVLMKETLAEYVLTIYKQLDGERFGGFMLFSRPVLLIRDPELIAHVLTKDFTHFHDRGLPLYSKEEPLTETLVTLTGDKWRQIRHGLTPTFTSSKLKIMFDQVKKCADIAVDFLERKTEALEVKQYMLQFNLNVIGLVAFGLKFDALNDKNEESRTFVKHSTRFFAPSIKTIINIMIRMSFPSIGDFLKLKFIDPEVSYFFVNLVKDTINYRETSNTTPNDFIQLMLDLKKKENLILCNQLNNINNNNVKDEPVDPEDKELLELLDKAPITNEYKTPVFTNECIAAQSFNFINSGTESSASTLSFTMYYLAIDPDVQRKAQKEIDNVLSMHEFDYDSVQKFLYLEQCLNEVMRLHPPAGALSRVCTEEFIIPRTDKVIEKGVLVIIPTIALHKDPQYFSDPETFNPDRFEDMNAIPKNVFMPFGNGPRFCIAKRLAMMKMKIYLAKLLSKYTVALSNKTQVPLKMNVNAIVPNVIGGIWIEFKRRY